MHSPRIVNVVGYWGIVLNITNLSGDIYVNFTISFALEMLAYVVCLYAFQHLGRKTIYITCIIAGGACCTLSIVPVLLGAPCEYGLFTSEKGSAYSVNIVYPCWPVGLSLCRRKKFEVWYFLELVVGGFLLFFISQRFRPVKQIAIRLTAELSLRTMRHTKYCTC